LNAVPAKARSSELLLRVVSAVLLAAVALALLYLGGRSFEILCVVGTALIAMEFRAIVAARLSRELSATMLAFLALTIALWFGAGADQATAALAGGIVLLVGWETVSRRSIWAATGLAYAGLPFLALCLLRGDTTAGGIAVVIVFAIVWGSDILAYFAGRTIGGPKLAPRISPKKTWAGFFGGIAGSLILCAAVAAVLGLSFGFAAAVLVALMSVVSQIGDLFESWIKRHFGVKDSGAIIPGHGGVMDRLDGLVFVSVAMWAVAILAGAQAFEPGSPGQAIAAMFAGS
jgi:phosphatidate cytidylyltransferase